MTTCRPGSTASWNPRLVFPYVATATALTLVQSKIPDDNAYFKDYGLTYERLKYAKPDAIVMHPGPMNRGVEIAGDVADDPKYSRMTAQVANGIPTRMAVLDLLLSK